MYKLAILLTIALVIALKCHGEIRRQFDHYKEFLEEKEKMALRNKKLSDYNMSSYYDMKKNKSSAPSGPLRNLSYNPAFGYEPYWMWGDWVFNRTRDNAHVCGYQCFKLYKEYGPVCAVSKNNEYISFKNICDVRSHDCYDRQMWRVIHRGACRNVTRYIYASNDLSNSTVMAITRAATIIDDFEAAYGKKINRRDMREPSHLEADVTNLHRMLH